MAEPTTNNRGLIVPNTGDLAGTWGNAALNPNFAAIDGMFGGVTTIGLTNANVTLTVPAGYAATPGAGPTQAQNAILRFTGSLTGNIVIVLPLPGYYICENRCSTNFVVQLETLTPGEIIALPNYTPTHVFSDGTNVRFVNLGAVGHFLDIASASIPAWMQDCTVAPYLLCDGTVYNSSTFPALGAFLGANFGGNGSTTFGVPDCRNRYRIPLGLGTNRIVGNGGSGVNGNAIGSAGGLEYSQLSTSNVPELTFVGSQADWNSLGSNYANNITQNFAAGGGAASYAPGSAATPATWGGVTTRITPSGRVNENSPVSLFNNLPPGIVTGLTMIKT